MSKTAIFTVNGRDAEFEVPDEATPEQAQSMFNSWMQSPEGQSVISQQTHQGMEHKVSHGQGMTAMPSTYNEQAALERTLMQDANPLERQAYGALSAPMLAGYGAKQFVTGGTLSPEDQNAVKNWHVVEKVAPLGAVAGNVGMMALPAQLLSKSAYLATKAPALVRLGETMLNPSSVKASVGMGAGLSAIQPTEQQGVEGMKQRGINTLEGGIAGLAGYGVAAAGGRILNPQTSEDVKLLTKEGIPVTVPQRIGGQVRQMESKLTSVPLVGDVISHRQNQAIDALNVAAYNRALAPIKEKASGKIGWEGVEEVHTKLSNKYEKLVEKMDFKPDQQFADDINKIASMVDTMPQDYVDEYSNILSHIVFSRATPQGTMNGASLKAMESDLTKKISHIRQHPQSWRDIDIANALDEVKSSIHKNLSRQNPRWENALTAVNKGWANYVIIRDAASMASGSRGMAFTPAQLSQAVVANAKKNAGQAAGKGKVSEGKALMQDLSGAANRVLAQAYNDSGTAGRVMMGTAALGGGHFYVPAVVNPYSLSALGIAMSPYISKNAPKYLMQNRPAAVRAVGQGLSDLSGAGAMVGAAGAGYYE